MGMVKVALSYFLRFYAIFSKKIVAFRFLPFSNPTVVKEVSIKKALNANECVRWREAFIANLEHPLWGSQSMQELASGMRNVLPFIVTDANSCVDRQPHKGCPRFAMNASIHQTHSFAFSAFSMEISFTTGFEDGQNLKLFFEKNA